MGREREICSVGRWDLSVVDQMSWRVGTITLASERISWMTLYNLERRLRVNETYTWAVNCPSTCGVVRTRPWCNAGLSIGTGTTKDEGTGGNFLLLRSVDCKSENLIQKVPFLSWLLLIPLSFFACTGRGILIRTRVFHQRPFHIGRGGRILACLPKIVHIRTLTPVVKSRGQNERPVY